MEKIKPCPFCGAEGEIWIAYSKSSRRDLRYIRCSLCGARGKCEVVYNDDPDDAEARAIRDWNRRADE